MLRVPISKARSGMVLALPIYHPNQPARALLRSGVTLEARTILRLRENGVRIVYVRYPGLELLDSFIDPKLIEERAGLTQAITAGFEEVARTAVAPRDFDQYRRRVAALLERITNNRRAALFVDELAEASDPLLEHSASVCFLALLLGIELESYLVRERPRLSPQIASDPAPLGLAGLLHDIGVAALDPEVRQRFDETGDETDPAWREHTRLGYELIRNEVETSVAAAVLNHHQHWDGSGFPTHRQYGRPPISPAGSKIHVFSRVICAADLFNRLRREPSNAENAGEGTSRGVCVPVVRALARLRQAPYSSWLDPMIFRALLAVAPAYPPGSLVTLSNKRKGVVIDWIPSDPCRPTVAPLEEQDDGSFELPEEAPIDLQTQRDVSIVEIDGFDVRRDNFYPSSADEFDLGLAFKRMSNRAFSMDDRLAG